MAATTTSRHQRSHSPSSGRFCSSSISSSSSFTMSHTSNSNLFHRSSSPTRINMYGSSSQSPSSPSSSVKFSIENRRPFSVNRNPFSPATATSPARKKTCMCSPTTHPGSFRCNFHKNLELKRQNQNTASYRPNRLNLMRSAMTNSLVRIGTVEGGEWVKRALATLIRPSSHQQRRRADFQPRRSRLSVMSTAADDNVV